MPKCYHVIAWFKVCQSITSTMERQFYRSSHEAMSDSRIRVPSLASKMSSDDMNALNSHLFQDETLRFNCATPQRRVGEPGPKTRELSGFLDDKLFSVDRARFFTPQGQDFRRTIYGDGPERTESRNWNGNGSTATASGKSSDEDDDEEEDDDDEVDDDGVGDVEGLVADPIGRKSNCNVNIDTNNRSGGSGLTGGKEIGNGKPKQHSLFEMRLTQDGLGKDGAVCQSGNHARASLTENNQLGRLGNYSNAVTIGESENDMYYSQFLQGAVSSSSGLKDWSVENGSGFSRRKDFSFNGDAGESLRAILSDPVTNALMDDAMILPCGHSFGSGGIQHVTRIKACYACSVSVSEDSIAPNLSLRAAVQAFRREEELQLYRSPKRRRERFDQDKNGYGDITLMDQPRGRGVQFPFSVTDRVIIKGNKRTPQRFVGREAVVTTQCLNGWYVVKTLDNAESVKLQYRSLARVGDDPPSRAHSSKISPNWL